MSASFAVLVVEDEPLIRWAIVEFLEDEGHRVTEAGNAAEAIAALEAECGIQLMFTDVDMPGSMDGLALARAVRVRWPPLRIIVTSGKRMVEITDLPDGSTFFSKPYSHRRILDSMREMLTG